MDRPAALSDRLTDRIDAKRDDLVDLTQALIRIPTLNPPGDNYLEICEFLARRLKQHGFQCDFVRAEGAPGDSERYPRWNLVARREGSKPGPCVHFNSHTDVVEVGQGWTKDPFGGALEDGKIYGRGSCDMKGGLAASIIAAEAFIELYPGFTGSIEISATTDEETGGYGGVAYLAEQGRYAHVDHVIIPEPLQKDRICLGHRGVWWGEIETHGEIAHGSMPFLGDCAVRHMGAVLREFEDQLFPKLAAKRTAMPVVPEGARQSTMNLNSFHGGQDELADDYTGWPSACVPDSARLVVDRRYLMEESADEVVGEIREILDGLTETRPDFRYDMTELWSVSPTMTEKDAPVVQTVSKSIRAVLGKDAEYVVSPGTYDQKHIDRIGKLKNCIAYGPGLLELAHKPDEYVGVEDMIQSAKVMALSLIDLLAPEEANLGD